jgi:predicted MFS family arabinose efflux permease
LALLSDLTPPDHRAKSMAIIGVSIGISFSIAMVLGPFLASQYGLSSIFYFTAALTILGFAVLYGLIPTATEIHPRSPFRLSLLWSNFAHPELRKLNLGILIQHALLTATFYALPLQLNRFIQQGVLSTSWHFYLPIVLISFLCMAPIVAISEKKQTIPTVLKYAVFFMTLSQGLLIFYAAHWWILIGLVFVYMVAFNLGEAFLPSQVSKHAPTAQRGTAMGIYSTSQFLGIFLGGLLAGLVYAHWGNEGVFALNTFLGILWWSVLMMAGRVWKRLCPHP